MLNRLAKGLLYKGDTCHGIACHLVRLFKKKSFLVFQMHIKLQNEKKLLEGCAGARWKSFGVRLMRT